MHVGGKGIAMSSEWQLSVVVGGTVQLGDHSWQVLDIQNYKALVLCEVVTEFRQFNRSFIDVTWETSTLRQYLNGDFYDKFSADEKQLIAETSIRNSKNPWFNTKEKNATDDKVFLLSLGEVVKYFGDSGCLANRPSEARRIDDRFNSARLAKDIDGTDSWWWLRTPGFYGLNAAYVNTGGWIYIDGNNVNLYGGIRPAMWINLRSDSEDDLTTDTSDIKDVSSDSDPRDFQAAVEKIRETDEHMHLMFDAAPLCCTLWDENLNVIDCNKAAVDLFGLSGKREYMKRFFEFSPPVQPNGVSSQEQMLKNHAITLREGQHRLKWMHRTADGEPMPAEVTLIRVKSKDSYIVASYVRDLREVDEAISKLRETDELVQLMLDATPLCCSLLDDSFKTIECNQEAVNLFKLSNKQEYLDKFYELSPTYQPCGRPSYETILENIGRAFRDGYYRFGWMHQRMDGTPIPAEVTLVRVRHRNGYIVAGYTRDLREHNKMIGELELALKQATEASRAKSDFLSAMSHEMRTPMNVIIGMTSIGKKADEIDEKNDALNKISETSAHLLGVINDVLDMAKIEADKLELVPVEFNFEGMLKKVLTVVSFRADEKKQTLVVNVDKKIPDFLTGDDQRLSQVITNLVDNAVKFTPKSGKIHLDISLIEEVNDLCTLRIEVTDSGIGISKEQQRRLFNAFEQVESGMNREYGGTGLGLVISRNIIELMDGKIWVESETGKGSKFIFTVNLWRSDKTLESQKKHISEDDGQSKAPEDTQGELAGKNVLIAEDVDINREILIALLKETGLEFECAENGKEAFDMVEAAPGKYDIVFMDLQMPHMDGYEATRRIRALPEPYFKKLPIVALTANVFTSDIEECLASGMNDHIGKPLDIDRIFEVLIKYLK